MAPGARVRIKAGAFPRSAQRYHLRAHEAHADLGEVIAADGLLKLTYVNVRFAGCPTIHRLLATELVEIK